MILPLSQKMLPCGLCLGELDIPYILQCIANNWHDGKVVQVDTPSGSSEKQKRSTWVKPVDVLVDPDTALAI